MKFVITILIFTYFTITLAANASIIVGGTRLIYDGNRKEASLGISNSDHAPYLIQSWIESVNNIDPVPFIVTPPLFRLDGGQDTLLRVVTTLAQLPTDKESLYWMNIKSIPSVTKDSNKNTLQIAVKTRIKLIYRPKGLQGFPEDKTEMLDWKLKGTNLQVTNPTPFYMNFNQIKINGVNIDGVTYVAPMSSTSFALPGYATKGRVTWKIISDYGSIGNEHQRNL